MRIRSDKLNSYKEDMKKYGLSSMDGAVPVDMYGRRCDYPKGAKGNLEKAGKEVQDAFGLGVEGY